MIIGAAKTTISAGSLKARQTAGNSAKQIKAYILYIYLLIIYNSMYIYLYYHDIV